MNVFERDKEYIAKLSAIKDEIEKNADSRPVTLLSGPSGSGKTTTAKMLEKMLDDEGYETHVISLDDYFKTMKAGEVVDFESPERVDGELLSLHIEQLSVRCQSICVLTILQGYAFLQEMHSGDMKIIFVTSLSVCSGNMDMI